MAHEEGCLVIDAPAVCSHPLVTNDRAKIRPTNTKGGLNTTCFRILGRKDNVIDSGGIKIQIEEVEHLLKSSLTADFAITSCPDERFGEAVVLLTTQGDTNAVRTLCQQRLPKFWQPRFIFHVPTPSPKQVMENQQEQRLRLWHASYVIQKHNIALNPTTFCILFSTQH